MNSASTPSPFIRNSRALTGNHLGQLGNVHQPREIDPTYDDARVRHIFQYYSLNRDEMEREIDRYTASPRSGQLKQAWQVLLMQL
ncbi:MAG: hypothetical protein ACK4E0_18970 [Chitinophagaceae bacterium]